MSWSNPLVFKHYPFEDAARNAIQFKISYFTKIENSWFHNSICVVYVPVKCTFHLVAGIVRVEAHDVCWLSFGCFFGWTWGQDCREAGQMWCWNGGYGPVLFSSASLSCMVLSVASDEYSARLHSGGWVQSPVTTVFRVFKTNYKVSMFCGCWRWQTCFTKMAFREHGGFLPSYQIEFFLLSLGRISPKTDLYKMGVSQNCGPSISAETIQFRFENHWVLALQGTSSRGISQNFYQGHPAPGC